MNVSDIHNCFGCGVCATICPKNVIKIELNKNGFYEPVVDEAGCIQCGLCRKTCSFSNEGFSLSTTNIHSYAAWSKDEEIRHKCSSGGVGYEIGAYLLDEKYEACGVEYDVKAERAQHFLTNSKSEYKKSIGSKYIQSYTLNAFKQIDLTKKTLVTGTPCQVDSFRRYIKLKKKEDNFVLMDFFCHGVPSMWMWDNYLRITEQKVGEIEYVAWRNKSTGWHDSWNMVTTGKKLSKPIDWHDSYDMLIREKKGFISSLKSEGDLFYRLFLGGWCMNPACCKECKFKYKNSSADIRIGDLWGRTYRKDNKGTSALIAFTEKGNHIIRSIDNIELTEHPFDVVAEGQMKHNAEQAHIHSIVRLLLNRKKMISEKNWNRLAKIELLLCAPSIIKNKIKKK